MNKIEMKTALQSLIENLEASIDFLDYGYFTSDDEEKLNSLNRKELYSLFHGLSFDEIQSISATGEVEERRVQEIKRLEKKQEDFLSHDFDIENMIDDIQDSNVSEEWKNEPAKETLDNIHEICENFEKIGIEQIRDSISKILDSLNEANSTL